MQIYFTFIVSVDGADLLASLSFNRCTPDSLAFASYSLIVAMYSVLSSYFNDFATKKRHLLLRLAITAARGAGAARGVVAPHS